MSKKIIKILSIILILCLLSSATAMAVTTETADSQKVSVSEKSLFEDILAEDESTDEVTDELDYEPSLLDEEKLIKCDATLEDDFEDDSVLVVLKNKESIDNLNEYDKSDFTEIKAQEVSNLSKYETKRIYNEYNTKKTEYKQKLNEAATLNSINLSDSSTVNAEKLAKMKIEKEHSKFHQILKINLNTKSKQAVLDAIKVLEKRDDIIAAEPNYITKTAAVPNDTKYSEQWAPENIKLPSAWEKTTGSKDVLVGVIDTGIKGTHSDLKSNINTTLSKSFVDSKPLVDTKGHGTHVAGIIGAVGNNSKGVAGTCWKVSLVSLKTTTDGGGSVSDDADAIDYAKSKNIKILNYSISAEKSSALEAAIKNYDGIFICAAGNESVNLDNPPSGFTFKYPSIWTHSNVISVASIDKNDKLASDSNYGITSVDLAAPGVNIYSTWNSDTTYYAKDSGTSMAAPFVAGVAALIKSKYPTISASGIKKAILDNVTKVLGLSGKVKTGGKLNANKAIKSVRNQTFTIKYNKNGGTGTTMEDTTVIYGIAQNLKKNTYGSPETAKTFNGWFAKRESDNKWLYSGPSGSGWYEERKQPSGYSKYLYKDQAAVAHSSGVKNDTITMYAQWRLKTYTIKFDGQGGVGTGMANQKIEYGVNQNLRKNTFNRLGYKFDGWTAHRKSDNKWIYNNRITDGWYLKDSQPTGYKLKIYPDQASVGKTSSVDGDIVTFYAQWKAINYSIIYNANGGSGSMTQTYGSSDRSVKLSANKFTRENYIFIGWNIVDDYGLWSTTYGNEWLQYIPSGYSKKLYRDGDYVNFISENGENLTAYAQWVHNSVVVGDVNRDGVINTSDVTLLQDYLAGKVVFTNEQIYAADFNKDGVVNINDVTALQRYIG